MSLICLKWSRSISSAASGVIVRDACATIRLIVSWTARWFGSPVSASVEARSSAIARLRRLASTGAAWPTASRMRRRSCSSGVSCWLTSTAPMTSPPTSSGSQSETPAQASADLAAHERRIGRHPRCARGRAHGQARARLGADERFTQSLESVERSLRLEPVRAVVAGQHDHARRGRERSTWRRRSSWASSSFSVTWSVSTYSPSAER